MAEYLTPRNWDTFQQYKDGRPLQWIKLHVTTLDDYEFDQLSEIEQLHLIKIWLFAGSNDGKIVNDSAFISRKIGAKSKLNLKSLIAKGFLLRTDSYEDSEESVPREEKRREEKEICEPGEIITAYHEILCNPQDPNRRPKVLEKAFRGSQSHQHLKARCREDKMHQNLDWWAAFFRSVHKNDWWMGRGNWKGVDLHWLLKKENFRKAIEHWHNLEGGV